MATLNNDAISAAAENSEPGLPVEPGVAQILDAMTEGVTVQDQRGRLCYANSAAAQLCGYDTAAELLAAPLPEVLRRFVLLDVAGQPFPLDHLPGRLVLQGAPAAEALLRIKIVATGKEYWRSLKATPLVDAAGRRFAVNTFRDVTPQQQVAEAVRHSEERYRMFVAQSSDGIWRFDLAEPLPTDWPEHVQIEHMYAQAYLAECNHALAHMYGYNTADEIRGARLGDFLPQANPHNLAYLEAFIRSGYRLIDAESHEVDRHGQECFFLNNLIGVVEAGQLAHVWGSQRDITAQKRAEQALRAQSEVLETVHRIGQLVVAELDLQKLVQAVTDAATTLTGAQYGAFFYNIHDDQGERYTLYTISGAPASAFNKFPMPRKTHIFGPTFRGEQVIRLADVHEDERYGHNPPYSGMPGGHLPVRSYMAVPVVSRVGEVLGGLFFGHPEANVFTERSEQLAIGLAGQAAIAMDNARLYAEAQQAIRARDQFFSVAAHELRTPLTSVLGFAELLQRRLATNPSVGPRDQRALQTLILQTRRFSTLIATLLDFSRLQSGRMQLSIAPLDLVALLRRVADETRETLERHTLTVAGLDAPLIIPGDELRLEQVLLNLLHNAIKYSPHGGPIDLKVEQNGEMAHVTVTDRGIGIPAHALPHVFQQFYRAPNIDARQIAGMGIGLYIVHEIVALHQGTIDVTSVEHQGSSFVVRLPLHSRSTN